MPATKAIPDSYHSIQPYLIFKGAAAALDFYTQAFGATVRLRMPRPDGLIAHAEMVLGDSCIMLADEAPAIGALSPTHYGGSPVSLMFYVEDCDAVYQQALAAGATSAREPADQPYGDRMAAVTDPFGYTWHLGTHIKDLTKEELEDLK